MELALLFVAHLTGDFILQNHWMQAKVRDSWICLVHVLVYGLLFWLLLPWQCVLLILVEHFLQDRFGLHVRWMRFYGHTPKEIWPVGPLIVDQCFHLLFITLVYVGWVAVS